MRTFIVVNQAEPHRKTKTKLPLNKKVKKTTGPLRTLMCFFRFRSGSEQTRNLVKPFLPGRNGLRCLVCSSKCAADPRSGESESPPPALKGFKYPAAKQCVSGNWSGSGTKQQPSAFAFFTQPRWGEYLMGISSWDCRILFSFHTLRKSSSGKKRQPIPYLAWNPMGSLVYNSVSTTGLDFKQRLITNGRF